MIFPAMSWTRWIGFPSGLILAGWTIKCSRHFWGTFYWEKMGIFTINTWEFLRSKIKHFMEISLGLGCNNQQLSIFGFVGQIEVPQNGYLNGVLCTGVFYGVPHGQTRPYEAPAVGHVGHWIIWSELLDVYPLIFRKISQTGKSPNELRKSTVFMNHVQ